MIPSLMNPPNAPKKKTLRRSYKTEDIPKLIFPNEEKMEYTFLASSGRVRQKFMTFTPKDVMDCHDKEWILDIQNLYTPSGQPHNVYEEAYCEMMRNACQERLNNL